jgi:hypothetical protein
MGPKLVDYLLYEHQDSGILWIKFNRPERMNALVGTAEENGTVAKSASTCAPAMTTQTSG